MTTLHEKETALRRRLRALDSAAVAFSGGTDSALLLTIAHQELGDKAAALTADSPVLSDRERTQAAQFCQTHGIRHLVVPVWEDISESFLRNPPNRCYFCKRALMTRLKSAAEDLGCAVLMEGSNVDDLGDYRPGRRAVEELKVLSPLLEAGLTKAEVRTLSRTLGLPTWNKPACACLASRFPYGSPITREDLRRVEQAEAFLLDLGFGQLRVRVQGDTARLELLPEEFQVLLSHREQVYGHFRALGFRYTTLDLLGYRTGSLNEAL